MAYAKGLPKDVNHNSLQEFPAPFKALASYNATTAVSSVITLTADTTVVEIGAAGGAGVVFRWVPSTDTAASVIASGAGLNFDHFVPADTTRRFVVPIEKTIPYPSIQGANAQNGLYSRVAWIGAAAPVSSVIANEF